MKLSKNFWLHEFVPPDIYEHMGTSSIWLLDMRIVRVCQLVRDRFAVAVTVNNWMEGGKRYQSGLRGHRSTVGARYSQHKYGRATDILVEGHEPQELRGDIRKNFKLYREAGLSTIEKATPGWVHLDTRHTGLDELFEVPYVNY
jgi:hypothetical protein